MNSRRQPRTPIANDNGDAVVVSLAEHRARQARSRLLMEGWAPAILATFFTAEGGSSPARRRRRQSQR